MAQVRAVTKIKGLPHTSGKYSALARYMAESKIDREREGEGARSLFDHTRDDLTYREAEESLTRGHGFSLKEDVKHLIVAFARRDYELLGGTRAERDQAMREIARKIVRRIADAAKVSQLEWYGAVHLNSPNAPHIHLGLGKNVLDRQTGRPARLEEIPSELLPRNWADESGEKRVVPGGISQLVGRELDQRQLERVRFLELTGNGEREKDSRIIRAVIPEQELSVSRPSKDEKTIGRWLLAEWEALTGKSLVERDGADVPAKSSPASTPRKGLEDLRQEARRIDAERIEQGLPELPAYLSPRELLALLRAESPAVEVTAYEDVRAPEEWAKQQERNHDARILGRWLIVTDERERLETRVAQIEHYGASHRFAVRDEAHGRERKVSTADVHRRAGVLARNAIEERQFRSGEERHSALEAERLDVIDRHRRTLDAHQRARVRALAAARAKLAEAEAEYAAIKPEIANIEGRYEASREVAPVPFLSSDEIEKLQVRALARSDLRSFDKLEAIRKHNAVWRGIPARDNYQRARLEAQRAVAEGEAEARRTRLERFDATSHHMRFTVSGEQGEWSLARVAKSAQQAEREYARTGLVGILHVRIKRDHAAKIEFLERIETGFREQLVERRTELKTELGQAQEKANRLAAFCDDAGPASARREVKPRFTDRELELLAGYAAETKQVNLLHSVAAAESAEVARIAARDPRKAEEKRREYAERARARSIVAELEASDAARREAHGKQHLRHVPLLVRDAVGRELVTTKWQWETLTLSEYIYARLLTSRGEKMLRAEVDRAFRDAQFRLEKTSYEAAEFHDAARTIVASYEHDLSERGAAMPAPRFTSAELARLDLYMSSLEPGREREHYRRLLEEAEGVRPRGTTERHQARELVTPIVNPATSELARVDVRATSPNERERLIYEPDDLAVREALERDAAEHEYASYDFSQHEYARAEQTDESYSRQREAERERGATQDQKHREVVFGSDESVLTLGSQNSRTVPEKIPEINH